jgi:Fe-S-cluster-containing dehydrogenase component
MMISYRGALILDSLIKLPNTKSLKPCNTCVNKPCINACPARAISSIEYNIIKCHSFLKTSGGKVCMTGACQVRTSCPISVAVQRDPEHNLLHMRAFKGEI